MLHAKFQSHRPSGSGKEDFLRFLLFIAMAAILVIWPEPFIQTLVPPSYGCSILSVALIGPGVSKEMFKHCERRQRTTEHGSPCEPNGSGEPKRKEKKKK